jgi:LmbE family N-acetylglucosaminyl deacetylase
MNLLAVGAHPDDIEIGCGGILAAHTGRGDRLWMVVLSAGEQGGADPKTRLTEFEAAARILGAERTHCLGYPDTCIPADAEVIRRLDQIVEAFRPDRAYIPFGREIHQDHRNASHVALAACRNIPQVLMYEGPSTFPDFVVTHYADIAQTLETKMKAIQCHASQGVKELLKIEAIQSLNRFRGYQARCRYAEGFAIFRFIERI